MASMEQGSPIKSWIRRHSPIKPRSRPQAPAPAPDCNGSPTRPHPRQPGRVISANISPTRSQSRDVSSHQKASKRKISSLWKAPQTPIEEAKSRHRRVVSSPVKYHDDRPSSSNSVESLSERVTTLEAQLRAAKAELAQASHVIKSASPFKSRPPGARRAQSYDSTKDIDRHVEERQRSLQRGHYYDGVVESLLEHDYATASRRSISYSGHGSHERRSASAAGFYEKAMSDDKHLEDEYTEDGQSRSALEVARRRSELRALEWKRMQEHMSSQSSGRAGSKRGHNDAEVVTSDRPARRQKHEKIAARDKALPELPQRSEKATSDRPLQLQPQAQQSVSSAHTIQYISLRRQASRESPSKSAPSEPTRAPSPVGDHDDNSNVTIYSKDNEEAEDYAPPSPYRRHVPSPSRLAPVSEEFEWNDEEIF